MQADDMRETATMAQREGQKVKRGGKGGRERGKENTALMTSSLSHHLGARARAKSVRGSGKRLRHQATLS